MLVSGSLTTRTLTPLLFSTFFVGCAAVDPVVRAISDVPQHLGERLQLRSELTEQRRLDKVAVHNARLEDMADERDTLALSRALLLERRRIGRETQMAKAEVEKEGLMAEARADVESATPDYKEQLRSQVELNFGQRVRVGQLQVNVDELEKLIKQRKTQQAALKADYDRRDELWRKNLADNGTNGEKAGLSAVGCARPAKEKLQDKEALEAPPNLALLPTEIPLMLPVSLDVELDNPSIRQARVHRVPTVKEGLEECKEALEGCDCVSCTTQQTVPRVPVKQAGTNPVPPLPDVDGLESTYLSEPIERTVGRASVVPR